MKKYEVPMMKPHKLRLGRMMAGSDMNAGKTGNFGNQNYKNSTSSYNVTYSADEEI